MLDMDGFKQLNDTFGHSAGDQALQDVVSVLRSYIKSGDLVCRLGGDEFLVWLRNMPYEAVIAKTVQQMCEHICKAYSHEVLLSASVGIAVYPRDGQNFDELYHNADKALYKVKQKNKGSYAFFSMTNEKETSEITEALAEVRQAPQSSKGSRRRILIVDDNESSRVLLKSVFSNEFLVETAKNGVEAMIRLRHFGSSISVVLLDLFMPDIDGFAILKKMQESTELQTVPVIIVTSDEQRETLLKAIDMGAAEYVTKPVDTELLRMRVQSAISKAENERLRAQNSYLMLQRDEEEKYRTVLESTGTVVVEYDWRNHVFIYDSEISKHIAGKYDKRSIWQVFLSDMIADSSDVKAMQDMMIRLAEERGVKLESRLVRLKTPDQQKHWFRISIYKRENEYGLAEKMIITFVDVHEEVLANEKLKFQATHDSLTGLYNRAGFIEKAAEMIATKEPCFYIMACVDIEKFRVINDQYGTEKGDYILKKIAQISDEFFREENGICCRIMADNFAVLYPASLIGSSNLKELQTQLKHTDSTVPDIRLAIGRCIVDDKSLDVSAIYDRASMAKDTIKGRYDAHIATFNEKMRTAILRQQHIIGQMNHALESGQFEIWLQPQINHSNGMISGAEALVRWRHPEEGIISPAEFIPIFERNGFVYEVDKFVWRQACILLRKWLDQGIKPVPVSVNISRYDVFRDDLIDTIVKLNEEYRLPLGLLRLEITESAFSESTDQIIDVVEKLVNKGFIVEIDDFGSGYSSLNTLKDVPAQILKMDIRFLENDRNVQRGGSIIESVVRMAKWLGMTVITEGVESIGQADYLKSIGCNYIQGYLYAKPMKVDDFELYCRNHIIEEKHSSLETIENLDQNTFWDPKSMDTLIFNSYVGSACILEYSRGMIEMLRATKHFVKMLGNPDISISDILSLNWETYLEPHSYRRFIETLTESKETKETVYGEFEFIGLPGCGKRTVLRGGVRVIAATGDRWLVYCISENITAQREAEENEAKAIRKHDLAAGQLKAILDNVDVGVVASVISDGEVDFLFANGRYFDLLGYTKEQFLDEIKDPFAIFAPECRESTKEKIFDYIRDETPGVIESYMIRRDGSRRLIRDTFSTCHFAGIDKPVQLSIFRDITDEREAELRVKRSAEEIRMIMENVNCGICAINLSDVNAPHFLFANDRFYTTSGYTKEQVKSEISSFLDLVHPDDRRKVGELLPRIISCDESVTFDFRSIRRDGSVVFLNCSVSYAEMSGYGKVAIVVQTDITEAIQSKQRIQQLANQLAVILNNTADSITAVSIEHGIPHLVFANTKHYEHLGVSEDEYVKKYEGNTDYIIDEDRERTLNRLFSTNSVGMKESVDFRIRRSDGNIRWMHSNVTVVNYPGVEGPIQLAVTSDITEQMEAVQKEQRLLSEMQTMMNDIPGGFARMKMEDDGRFTATYCNEGFCKLLGYEYDSLVRLYGDDPMADVHPDDVPLVKNAFSEIKKKGRAHSSRYRLRCSNGEYIWVTVFGRISRDHSGNSYINLYYSDETALEKESRYRTMLMDNLPWGAGIYEFMDGQMSLIYQNNSYWELVGLSKEDCQDSEPMSAIHPDDIPIVMQGLSEAIRDHKSVLCDIRLLHIKYGYRYVSLSARVIEEGSGVYLIVATFVLREET